MDIFLTSPVGNAAGDSEKVNQESFIVILCPSYDARRPAPSGPSISPYTAMRHAHSRGNFEHLKIMRRLWIKSTPYSGVIAQWSCVIHITIILYLNAKLRPRISNQLQEGFPRWSFNWNNFLESRPLCIMRLLLFSKTSLFLVLGSLFAAHVFAAPSAPDADVFIRIIPVWSLTTTSTRRASLRLLRTNGTTYSGSSNGGRHNFPSGVPGILTSCLCKSVPLILSASAARN